VQTLGVKTDRRTQLVDVTAQVQKAVASSGVATGICYLYVPHTHCTKIVQNWTFSQVFILKGLSCLESTL